MGHVESDKDNLIFPLDGWSETGASCDFALSPSLITPILAQMDADSPEDPPNLVTSLRGHLDLQLSGRRLVVKGSFAVRVEMACSRCLSTFIGKVGDTIDEVLELGSPTHLNDLEMDEDSFIPVKNGYFDLTPLLCELFWLSWPLRAICRSDCKGLCPGCGVNLNGGPSLCREKKVTRH